MNEERIRAAVLGRLREIAPEADLEGIDPEADLREEIDLDSMDLLKLVTGIHADLGVTIPEADYGKITTLRSCVEYLARRS